MNTTEHEPLDDQDQEYADEGGAMIPHDDLNARLRQAEEMLTDLNDRAMTFIREHPGVCIAGALALGYLVGRAASKRWLR